VQLSTALAGGLNSTVTLGQSFSAADAIRAFSTATNPALPPGTVPTVNPIIAFPGTRQAVPVQTVFSNPVPTGPGAPGTVGGVRPGSLFPGSGTVISPIGLLRPAPTSPALTSANVPAAQPAASPAAASGQLPYTGVDAGSLIGLGLLVLVTGTGLCVLVRLATTRPARHGTARRLNHSLGSSPHPPAFSPSGSTTPGPTVQAAAQPAGGTWCSIR